MLTAIIFPANPEASVFDLTDQAQSALKRGARLYTNGRQMALLLRPAKGWALFGAGPRHAPAPQGEPPCAA